jgi:hypothetical protein
MKSHWRTYAAPIIAAVLKETAGQDERAIRKALTAAYPFGERAMHPYKMWLAEVRAQRGKQSARRPSAEIEGQERLEL